MSAGKIQTDSALKLTETLHNYFTQKDNKRENGIFHSTATPE